MDILRKRTFLEETASAKVEVNSGDTAMPEVADMMDRKNGSHQFQFNAGLTTTLMNTPQYVPYQAYKVRLCLISCSLN
jgi:hypothetical protein